MYDLLEVKKRDLKGERASQLRNKGMIPGVIYAKGMESRSVKFNEKNFKKIFLIGVKVFELDLVGEEKYLVNLNEVQRDPVTRQIVHISFHLLNKNQATHVLIPLKLEGSAVGSEEGGVVRLLLDEVIIEGFPHKIPEFLSVNVESLGVGDHLSIQDIPLGEGLSFNEEDLEKAVVNCAIPKVIQEPVEEKEISGEEIQAGGEGQPQESGAEAPGGEGKKAA